ncbi:MAG: methyltransferase domain-containing protein [Bryobacterales bacterium]|nr:methyltransferase domain-containing protein [Bryobacterales bacterium]MBV9402023.1 methyltransferase domain-containing protein [Bryobacterales bacterium]
MTYARLRSLLPGPLFRYVLHFENQIDESVREFARSLNPGARVLDAGAGETQYKHYFKAQRYVALDLAVGDKQWDYSKLDVLGELGALPFSDGVFDASVNIVTLEHVKDPARVVAELSRTLGPGGRLLVIAPHEWEEHQQPHDYYRYTRYGLQYLLCQAGLEIDEIRAVGGFFRLLSRRLFNALQFFPGPWMWVAAIFFVPPALVLPLLDRLDSRRNFTLGYICRARKRAD